MRRAALLLLTVPLLAGCLASEAPDAAPPPADEARPAPDAELLAALEDLSAMPELRLETDHGTLRVLLYDAWLPETAGHVAGLADSGFYDDTLVHRVVDDFVIQGGDPSGTGQLGSGETVPLERDARLDFAAGSVGLARDVDEDSGDSQWFVAETPQPHLSRPTGATGEVFGAYALFGQLFEGLDVVRAIAAEPTVPGADRPVEDVVVASAEVLPPPVELDLLGVVRAIEPGLTFPRGNGTLDRPLWLVAGHPYTLLVHDDAETGEDFDPRGGAWIAGHGGETAAEWTETSDPGTWEATVTFPEADSYRYFTTMQGCGTCTATVRVLPWSDAYAAFTGASTE